MAVTDEAASRLAPVQLAKFFQSLQGSAEWRRQASVKTAGVLFGDCYLILRGDLSKPLLERAWQQVTNSEPMLRASFDASSVDRPLQRVHPHARMTLEILDWTGSDESRCRAELAALRLRESDRGFDLASPPLARLTAARIGAHEHWLIIAAHEVILDNRSIMLLFNQLLRCYGGLPAAGPPGSARQAGYQEYAENLRRMGVAEAERFWTAMLAGFRRPVQIGGDADAGAGHALAIRQAEQLPIDDGLSAVISGQSAREGLLPESLFHAAFALALSRYSGEEDVVIGIDLPGRDHAPGLAGMVGPFRNTVPLRVALDEEETAASLLHRVDTARRAVAAHEYMPEPLIREWSDPSLARAWLYAHIVTMAQETGALYQPEGLEATAVPLEGAWQPRPLGLTLRRRAGRLDGEIVFCTSMIGDHLARQFGRHLVTIVRGLLARPPARLRDVVMLDGDEQARILRQWNRTGQRFPAGRRIEDLIWPWAQSRPEAIAVRGVDESLTYRQLLARAASWAAALGQAGAGPHDLVGVHMRRTPELVAALLGTFMAGAAYVPLDPAYPAPRLAAIAADAGLKMVLDDTASAPGVVADGALLPRPEPLDSLPPPPAAGDADDLAYVLYTSGSTGQPKGVEIRHRNAVNMVSWAAGVLGEDLAAFLATTSINFDCSILELFATLSAGGTINLSGGPLSGAVLQSAAGSRIVNGVPSVMAEALRDGELPSSVRTVILGGEPPWPALIDRIRAGGHVRRILNLYGPTETTSYSTMAVVGATIGHPPPIGRPIANTQAYVLDRYQNPVPVGVTGELYIGGAGVARGYRGLPELTQERFVPDTVAGAPGGCLYRTGDLVRYAENGDLLFVGRADTQVKIHGVRIETGEVEHVLTTVPGIAEAVVLADRGQDGQVTLTAWVTPSDPAEACPAAEEVRARLSEMLPGAMIPANIIVTGDLPRLPNGKADREQLHARAVQPRTPGARVKPRTSLEQWLADTWAALLGIEEISITDDFFELGGDSFLAMRMISRAQEEGLPAEPADIYTAATITSLASLITSRSAGGEPGPQDTPHPGTIR